MSEIVAFEYSGRVKDSSRGVKDGNDHEKV
jgi:hypothetical protein